MNPPSIHHPPTGQPQMFPEPQNTPHLFLTPANVTGTRERPVLDATEHAHWSLVHALMGQSCFSSMGGEFKKSGGGLTLGLVCVQELALKCRETKYCNSRRYFNSQNRPRGKSALCYSITPASVLFSATLTACLRRASQCT